MLEKIDFKEQSQKVIDWIDSFYKDLKSLPVKSQSKPKDIYKLIPAQLPIEGESLDAILKDTTDIILPGITHWQHPNFHAYFPANSSIESLFAEMITTALGSQCMIWETSPAAAELEERMMEWMRDAMGLPSTWEGVIQDTASTATLCAILSARERTTNFTSNEEGVPPNLRVYCSTQTHSSIEKGVAIAGIGRKNLVKIDVDDQQRMSPTLLKEQIEKDIHNGLRPSCVIVALGTTSTVAIDELTEISSLCQEHNIWLHIDAAYAGTALFLPEYRWMMDGGEKADSFVFNPHKWLFTNFDCTAYYVKDADHLIKTFEILPEYLKTKTRGHVNDYRDWGVPLGRRFRALKLWFVMRSYGLSGIQQKLRKHIELNNYFSVKIKEHPKLELIQEPFLNFTCLRYVGDNKHNPKELNYLNEQIIEAINKSGKAFLSHTVVNDIYMIRVVIGQTYVEQEDVDDLYDTLIEHIPKG